MSEFCKVCGRAIERVDTIAWKYFGWFCGGCFLLFAKYILKNTEELEFLVRANDNAPGIWGDA